MQGQDVARMAATRRDAAPWTVGIVGSGLVTRSIHLPALAGLSDRFTLRAIWDVDADLATATAAVCGARTTPTLDALLEDAGIDVVAICSPARFHAEQAVAALRAGAKAVLIEKPLCMSIAEAQIVAAAADETGGIVVVGAMHMFDPAWQFLEANLRRRNARPAVIRSSIVLPPNARFDAWASERIAPAAAARPPEQRTAAMLVHASIMGLGIHDLPLVRRLLSDDTDPVVLHAARMTSFGHMISLRAGDQIVDLFAMMHRHWRPEWTLTASAPDWQAHLEFTPSFVPAGSGTATIHRGDAASTMSSIAHNGYAGEWIAIDAMLAGTLPPPRSDDLVRDFAFAHSIAEQAATLMEGEQR